MRQTIRAINLHRRYRHIQETLVLELPSGAIHFTPNKFIDLAHPMECADLAVQLFRFLFIGGGELVVTGGTRDQLLRHIYALPMARSLRWALLVPCADCGDRLYGHLVETPPVPATFQDAFRMWSYRNAEEVRDGLATYVCPDGYTIHPRRLYDNLVWSVCEDGAPRLLAHREEFFYYYWHATHVQP